MQRAGMPEIQPYRLSRRFREMIVDVARKGRTLSHVFNDRGVLNMQSNSGR